MDNSSNEHFVGKYIYRDPEATQVFSSDLIHLTNANDGRVIVIKKSQVTIGGSKECDLCIENQMVELQHADMCFKDAYWFLRDLDSSQGTYLNGERLEAGVYYQLLAGDKIVFGQAQPLYFERNVREYDAAKSIVKIEQELGIRKYNIDKYKALRKISEDSFYSIYLVENTENATLYAMKVCDKTKSNYSQIMRDTLISEAYMMQDLEYFAIPKLIEVFETDEMLGVIREYVEGISLEQNMKKNGVPTVENVVKWAKMTCYILRYLHTMTPPHIYRDVKPANLILDTKGQIHIIDFGTMRTYKDGQSKDTATLGTVGYAAPEQFGSRQTDQRTDIYGLGMTMYRLVTGENIQNRECTVKSIREIDPRLPKGLEYVISKCIELDPDKRYQSCEELLIDLDRYQELPKSRGIFSKIFGRK